jgi:Flp pilus assembly protein protease CpaA
LISRFGSPVLLLLFRISWERGNRFVSGEVFLFGQLSPNLAECPAAASPWMLWGICASVAWAAFVDGRRREIPHAACLAVLLCSVGLWFERGDVWPWRVLEGVLGGLVSAGVVGLLYYLGGVAGGDVKLLTALGIGLGLAIFEVLLCTALFGAVAAAVAASRKQRDFAYGPAILAAVLTHAIAPNALWRLTQWQL